jgi:hypothetical protein
LVGEDESVGKNSLHTGGHRRCPSVRRPDAIHVKVVVGENAASHRTHMHCPFSEAHLVDDLSDQTVNNAVVASWTEVPLGINQRPRAFIKNLLH